MTGVHLWFGHWMLFWLLFWFLVVGCWLSMVLVLFGAGGERKRREGERERSSLEI